VFSNGSSSPAFYLMRLYNARLARIARNRRRRNQLGRANHGRRLMFQGYTFSRSSLLPVLKALAGWMRLELIEGWRTWLPAKARAETGAGTQPRPDLQAEAEENSKVVSLDSEESPLKNAEKKWV
jgi:hypothetical protein